MPRTRSQPAAAKPAARSARRATAGPVAARDATLAVCAKPVDEAIRTDPSDTDARERVARVLARRTKTASRSAKTAPPKGAKRETTKRVDESAPNASADKAVTPRISASKLSGTGTSASRMPASRTPATRKPASKKLASETSVAKTPASGKATARRAGPTTSPRAKASVDGAAAWVAEAPNNTSVPEQPRAVQAEASVLAEPEAAAKDGATDAVEAPRRRGPSGVTRTAVDKLDDPPPESGVSLIDSVSRAVEREITQIGVIVGGHHLKQAQRTEAERRARTLASLARTLAELRKLRSDEDRKRARDDDAIPRDLDELRRALSRRLEQMVAGAADLPAAGDE